ncbi:MAG: ThuA domain-containing protein [Phycisphaerales bacterium]|nr:MAG: ThuA domain-containing protein [Phycisphaerales bacterium]
MADNLACFCCHVNYEEEPLAVIHAKNNIGCEKCHGESFEHRNDENNVTPPDIIFPPEKIAQLCGMCHDGHDVPTKKVIARWWERRLEKIDASDIVCTDCHGQHRLKIRTVRWDKHTEDLIVSKPEERKVDEDRPKDDKNADAASHPVPQSPLWLTYKGASGPGSAKHIVLIAADQEYRSEQSMPMLTKILAKRHGFDCTVLFSVNDKGEVDPTIKIRWEDKSVIHNIPGLEYLQKADLLILFSRLITLPDEQIKHIIDYLDSGKPIIGIRTANHGFLQNFPYEINGRKVRFGDDVLGGSFRGHHGNWHADSTRGILVEEAKDNPILRGVEDIWGPSDVYRTYPKGESPPAQCQALVYGQPLLGRNRDDSVNKEKEPLPIAWTKTWTGSTGQTARVFHVTMGSAKDYQSAGVRRLTINAAYWCLRMEQQISATSSVEYVGEYRPLASGFQYDKLNVVPRKPATYR